MFPNDNEEWPFFKALIAVTSSGRDVPSATRVRDITRSGTLSHLAITVPLSTSRSAPIYNETASIIRKIISLIVEECLSSVPFCIFDEGCFIIFIV